MLAVLEFYSVKQNHIAGIQRYRRVSIYLFIQEFTSIAPKTSAVGTSGKARACIEMGVCTIQMAPTMHPSPNHCFVHSHRLPSNFCCFFHLFYVSHHSHRDLIPHCTCRPQCGEAMILDLDVPNRCTCHPSSNVQTSSSLG